MLAASAARSLLAQAARPLASSVLPAASFTRIGATHLGAVGALGGGGAIRSATAVPAEHLNGFTPTMVKTVTFNVGGRRFEVTSALIDGHSETLGRLVSDTWNEDPGKEVFIDRDGDLFAHVLNYLRCGSIELPITVPRSMFDREIDYYGINSPDEAKIVTRDSLVEIMGSLQAPVVEAEKRLEHVQGRRDDFLLAAECFRQHCEKGSADAKVIEVSFHSEKDKSFYETARRHERGRDVEWLDTCLGHFGLKLTARIETGWGQGGTRYCEIPVKIIE